MPRPKQRTPELHDRVLSTAVGVLSAEGVSAFTTRRIAKEAQTSIPAVYELFGGKGGLIREVFFEGFRMLYAHLQTLQESDDPRADLIALMELYRQFVRDNRFLSEVMFSRPFTDFEPEPSESEASGSVRVLILRHVGRCIDAELLHGDQTDIAHALVALTQGLASAENARRLGSSQQSIDRRWRMAVTALLDGLSR